MGSSTYSSSVLKLSSGSETVKERKTGSFESTGMSTIQPTYQDGKIIVFTYLHFILLKYIQLMLSLTIPSCSCSLHEFFLCLTQSIHCVGVLVNVRTRPWLPWVGFCSHWSAVVQSDQHLWKPTSTFYTNWWPSPIFLAVHIHYRPPLRNSWAEPCMGCNFWIIYCGQTVTT